MKLILTRHGETVDNIKGILQGQNPGKLSENGIQQAKQLALRLKNENIDAIYSSDLARAADTAKEIYKFHPKIPLYFVKELREGDCGSFTGKKESEIDWKKRPDDAESLNNMQKRVRIILEAVFEKHKNQTILFVGHNGINKSLVTVINNLPAHDLSEIDHFDQTSISIFDIQKNQNQTILFNAVDHLKQSPKYS